MALCVASAASSASIDDVWNLREVTDPAACVASPRGTPLAVNERSWASRVGARAGSTRSTRSGYQAVVEPPEPIENSVISSGDTTAAAIG